MMSYIEILKSFGQTFYQIWWIILPVAFYYVFMLLWDNFVKGNWADKLTWTMIEIIPPKELEKGPKPMESIYYSLAGVIASYNAFDEYIMGMDTDKFSFELAGLDGEVHFYISVQERYRNLLEATIYAQYPSAEIIEVPDYMQNFPKIMPNRDWDVWGTDIMLSAADPIPIKTYDKFEEDITGTMIDPMASFMELFATLPPGQNLALQFVIKPLSESWKVKEMELIQKLAGRVSGSNRGIFQDFMDVFTHIFAGLLGPVEFPKAEKKDQQPLAFRLTPGEQEQLKAIEENLSKNMFKVKMRVIYFGKKEGFDKSVVSAFFGAIKQFNDLNLNNFRPDNNSKTAASFVASNSRVQTMKRRIFDRYRRRNTDGLNVVFSTSELATLYHLPDMGVMTPALPRVESKKGTAPSNLPIG
jgi:hypothetical protein